jgi:hypothetical protein
VPAHDAGILRKSFAQAYDEGVDRREDHHTRSATTSTKPDIQ